MTHIEQMIQDMCPNGVEFKTLGDVCEIRGRIGFRGYTRQDQVSKGEGAISLSPANIKGSKISYDDCTYITWEKYEESPEIMVDNGDVIFCKTASVGKTAYIDELPEKATINPQLVLLKKIKCNSKFLSYYLQTPRIQDVVKQMQGVGSVPNVSQAMLSKLPIPLPPVEIQERIVAILDRFSALAAELQAELQKRRTQYEYYRTRLLTPPPTENISSDNSTDESKWEWKTLGEVATLSRGKVYSKEYLRDNKGDFPVYSSQTANNGELGRINSYDYDGDYLTWTTDGAYAGTVFRRTGKFSITNVCGLISNVDKSLSMDFLFYWLNKVAKNYVYQGMGNPKLMSNIMSTVLIAIPPMSEQARIVSILDKFEALTTSLSDGIPAEQAAQQKRYEYYRDLLLTFDRKNV